MKSESYVDIPKIYLTVDQQSQLDALGKQKTGMTESDWISKVSELVFSFIGKGFFRSDKTLDQPFIDTLTNTILKLGSFDPTRGLLSHYFNKSFQLNGKTQVKKYEKSMNWGGMKEVTPKTLQDNCCSDVQGDSGRSSIPKLVGPLQYHGEDGTEYDNPDIYEHDSGRRKRSPYDSHIDRLAYEQTLTAAILNYWSSLESQRRKKVKPKSKDKKPLTREDLHLYRMWYSEIEAQWLQMGYPYWRKQDIIRALDFAYLDLFLETDFMDQKNRTVEEVQMSRFKDAAQTRFRAKPVKILKKGEGKKKETEKGKKEKKYPLPDPRMSFLPLLIAQEHAAAISETETTSWEKGYPAGGTISTSRTEYLKKSYERYEQIE